MTNDVTTARMATPAPPAPTEREQIYLRARRMMHGGASSEQRQDVVSQLASLSRKATRQEIAEHLAVLLKAFDVGKADLEGRARILAEDVGASEPSVGVLELACRNLRRTAKFLPSIAEVFTALKEANSERLYIFHKLGHRNHYQPECSIEHMLPIERHEGW